MSFFEIAAVADKDTKLAEKVAGEYGCKWYDDYRQLVIQNQFDCLLVAEGLHRCEEYIRTGMKKKFNILKYPPLGRNLEEARGFVRLAEENGIKFAVINTGRFSESFISFRRFIQEGSLKRIFLVKGVCNCVDDEEPSWHYDKELSGGGVLLRSCYELIDQILWNFHSPNEVYSAFTNTASDRQQSQYLTEDTALLTMKFSKGLIGHLSASRVFGPNKIFLEVFGKEKILTVTNCHLTVRSISGEIIEAQDYGNDELVLMKGLLENFALSIVSPDNNKLFGGGEEGLKTMSVIECAYLSGRTGMPESPSKIWEIGEKEPASI